MPNQIFDKFCIVAVIVLNRQDIFKQLLLPMHPLIIAIRDGSAIEGEDDTGGRMTA